MTSKEVLQKLPYSEPFFFVDELEVISESGIIGSYTFPEDSFFYKGHFKEFPVTPGVILTECMAQIGLACLGIVLMPSDYVTDHFAALTSTNINFFLPVFPGERVEVQASKVYFRFNKLKCKVKMLNTEGKLVCEGEISGIFKE